MTSTTKGSIEIHKKRVHGIAKTYRCKNCNFVVENKEALKTHKDLEHPRTIKPVGRPLKAINDLSERSMNRRVSKKAFVSFNVFILFTRYSFKLYHIHVHCNNEICVSILFL